MESTISLETKYQTLAAEYSKLRANANVLKKAVLEEKARSKELKDTVKEQEQRLRKTGQEMESLTFRNQQLTKRISVLQEELNTKNNVKHTKGKSVENNTTVPLDTTLFDEELQKKIMDNARLISEMADKDFELSSLHERIRELEEKLRDEEKRRIQTENEYQEKIQSLKNAHIVEVNNLEGKISELKAAKQNGEINSDKESIESESFHEDNRTQKQRMLHLEQEKERWKSEYELLLLNSEGEHSDREKNIKEYFYKKINDLVSEKQEIESMSNTFIAECNALQLRLELCLEEESRLREKISSSLDDIGKLQEELNTTSRNYETQLSAMSEHLADLNDKYTEQCETIHQLNYQLGIKSKKK